jgi:hypothetical protein
MPQKQAWDWIDALTNASFLWGPFFFSILFILVVTRTAHSYYARVNERVTPPASAEERQDYRNYFRLSIVSGLVLVFLSVGWWMYAQLHDHMFQGVITGLEKDQQIVPADDDLYYRAVQREAGFGRVIRDYHFVIVRATPFANGQVFKLQLYPEAGAISEAPPKPEELKVQYRGTARDKYLLVREDDKFKLVRVEN